MIWESHPWRDELPRVADLLDVARRGERLTPDVSADG